MPVPAVGIDHGLSAVEVGIGEGFFIEELGLRLVHLKEGEGGRLRRRGRKGRKVRVFFAPEMMDFFSEDGIALVALDIVIDGDDFGGEVFSLSEIQRSASGKLLPKRSR